MFIPNYVLATKGQRFLNFILDRIFFYLFLFIFGILLGIIAELTDNYEITYWMENIDTFQDIVIKPC